ncbi:MAG: aldo/keto reductase [Spirochaetales bacterium]|nr:aldo/keto reductase [Spirochaetales bacterium]
MKYRYLGNSGLAVSRICLGTATFGEKDWGCDASTSAEILNAFTDQGGNFIDTADKYAGTRSEEIIGKWLSGRNRDDLVIATKCFFPTSDNINSRGLSRKHILNACENSLKRLKTDYIDLYQVHESDPQTPIEETLAALNILIQQGKVRYIGLSNWPAWKVMKASFVARERGLEPFISGQYLYNLLKRDIESEVIPACKESGMGIVCWCPLSGGMLTGKYRNENTPPQDTRMSNREGVTDDRYKQWVEKSNTIVNQVMKIADSCHVTPAVVALAWMLQKRHVSSVSVGAKRAEQIIENCNAGNYQLSKKNSKLLSDMSEFKLGNPYDIIYKIKQDWLKHTM